MEYGVGSNNIVLYKELMDRDVPLEVRRHPGMISPDERRFFYNYVAEHYTGKGVIVDGGALLGASTRCFGEAINASPRRAEILAKWPKPIHSYERTLMTPNLLRSFAAWRRGPDINAGDSFERVLRDEIEDIAGMVELNVGDILAMRWSGEPIEILFLDVLKTPEINRHALREYFPRLVPGALVIQQDYFIDSLPYIKTTQEAMSDHFDFVAQLRPTGVFQLKQSLSHEVLAAAEDISTVRQLELIDAAKQRALEPYRKILVEISKIHVLARGERKAEAVALLDSIAAEVSDDAPWRLNDSLDRARRILRLPMRRPGGGWIPPLPERKAASQ